MRIGCQEACACLTYCYESVMQTAASTIESLERGRRNPEVFQKTCILVSSTIQGFNFLAKSNRLPEFASILNMAQSFDFYGFCRLPRYIFHPYIPGRLDEDVILDQLETILCQNWKMGQRDRKVRTFAKERLVDLLEEMLELDFDVRTEAEFRTLLQDKMVDFLEHSPKQYPRGEFDPQLIDISALSVKLKRITFLEYLSDFIFIGIDIACVPSFLHDWAIFDLSLISNKLGRIAYYSLDDWISAFMCIGYSILFIEAFRSLISDDLSRDERRNAKWIMVASVAETLYNGAILFKKELHVITFLAIGAKLLGLIQIWQSPKISFFTEPS